MRLVPTTTNIYSPNMMSNKKTKVSFGSNENRSTRDNFFNSYATYAATLALLSGAVTYKCAHDDLEASRDRLNNMFDRIELEHDLSKVKSDTLKIEDVTGDNHPELILYNDDGSEVVIDISNAKKLNYKN